MKKFRNKKNGNIYIVEKIVCNATNAQNGQKMYLYYGENDPNNFYVRSVEEFLEKFEDEKTE